MIVLAWMFWLGALWADSVVIALACYLVWIIVWAWFHLRSYPSAKEGARVFCKTRTHRALIGWLKLEVSPVLLACWMWRCYHVTLRKGWEGTGNEV